MCAWQPWLASLRSVTRLVSTGTIVACVLQGASMATVYAQAQPFQEFNRNYGLNNIGVLWPWGAGATGRGVIIALVDSGITGGHADLAGNVLPGIDFVDGDSVAEDQSDSSHGTFMAGIIAGRRNNNGIVGVAYDAKLLPIRVTDEFHRGTEENLAKGIRFAANSAARVINIGIATAPPRIPDVGTSLQLAASNGKVIVMPAGNTAAAGVLSPAFFASILNGQALIAGATGPNGQISDFSNRAGSLMQHYVVAPGVDIRSTTRDGDFGTSSGTSWASGYVSGSAALLAGAFPELDAATIVRILKETATDLGVIGVDNIYGWGQINVRNAMAPQGQLEIPGDISGGGGGGGSGIGAIAVVAAVAVGSAIAWDKSKRKKTLKKAMIIDKYGRGYTADVTGLINPTDSQQSLRQVLSHLRQKTERVGLQESDISMIALDFSRESNGVDPADARFDPESETPNNWNLTINSQLSHNLSFGYARNGDTSVRTTRELNAGVFADQTLEGATYLNFGGQAQTWSLAWQPAEPLDVRFGYVDSDEDQRFGNHSEAALIEFNFQPSDSVDLGLQLSQTNEKGSLLGGSSNGPLSVERATTTAIGISAGIRLSAKVSVYGAWQMGHTRAVEAPQAILTNVSRITSQAYGLGLAADSLWSENDRVGITISRPLRVNQGSGTLSIPIAFDTTGGIVREREHWDLSPDAKETDLELFYQRPLGERGLFGAHFLYRNNALIQKPTAMTCRCWRPIGRPFRSTVLALIALRILRLCLWKAVWARLALAGLHAGFSEVIVVSLRTSLIDTSNSFVSLRILRLCLRTWTHK